MTKEKVNAIALSLTIVGSISMLLIIALVVMAVYGSGNLIIQQTVPMYCVSFVAPYIVRHRKEFEYNKEIWLTTSFMLVGLILLWEDSLWIKNDMGRIICHYCVVGLAEEYVYRGCIMDILSKEFGKKITILISAVIFAFVGHLDSNFVDNLTFRLLLGIVLGMIYGKTRSILSVAIVHSAYDICITLR